MFTLEFSKLLKCSQYSTKLAQELETQFDRASILVILAKRRV